PLFGRPKSELIARYPEFVDSAAVRASIESREIRDPELVPALIRSFNGFHAAHSVPLDFAAKDGFPAAALVLAAQLALVIGSFRRFGGGLEGHLVLLSSYRFLFGHPSRASMALFFVQAGYLWLSRGEDRQSTGGVR